MVWQWDNADPFGNNVPNENPSNLGQFSFNLRFAGQYADKETGLYYNVFRTYDPASGRYIESDPIGLWGGTNTYAYLEGNPLIYSDQYGLKRKRVNLGGGYIGDIDVFDVNGESSFEIHVKDKNGKEIGMYGPEGWFDKHGLKGRPEGIPESVENQCKGQAVDMGRKMKKIPPRGEADIKGGKWKRFFKKAPLVGDAMGIYELATHPDMSLNDVLENAGIQRIYTNDWSEIMKGNNFGVDN